MFISGSCPFCGVPAEQHVAEIRDRFLAGLRRPELIPVAAKMYGVEPYELAEALYTLHTNKLDFYQGVKPKTPLHCFSNIVHHTCAVVFNIVWAGVDLDGTEGFLVRLEKMGEEIAANPEKEAEIRRAFKDYLYLFFAERAERIRRGEEPA